MHTCAIRALVSSEQKPPYPFFSIPSSCRYILSITNEDEIREYVVDLIQGTDGKKSWFVEELLARWRKSSQLPSEPLPAYRKKDGERYGEEGIEVSNKVVSVILFINNYMPRMPVTGPISVLRDSVKPIFIHQVRVQGHLSLAGSYPAFLCAYARFQRLWKCLGLETKRKRVNAKGGTSRRHLCMLSQVHMWRK